MRWAYVLAATRSTDVVILADFTCLAFSSNPIFVKQTTGQTDTLSDLVKSVLSPLEWAKNINDCLTRL